MTPSTFLTIGTDTDLTVVHPIPIPHLVFRIHNNSACTPLLETEIISDYDYVLLLLCRRWTERKSQLTWTDDVRVLLACSILIIISTQFFPLTHSSLHK
jgi:hypothetical protein